jgi:hypothetical protein
LNHSVVGFRSWCFSEAGSRPLRIRKVPLEDLKIENYCH